MKDRFLVNYNATIGLIVNRNIYFLNLRYILGKLVLNLL